MLQPKPPGAVRIPASVRGGFALAIAIGCWVAWAIVTRSGMKAGYSPWDLAFLRFLVAGVVLAPVLWRMGLKDTPWWAVIVITLGAGPGYVAFAYSGAALAPASHVATLTAGVLPLFTTLLTLMLKLERITRLKWIALSLIVGGAAFFLLDSANGATASGADHTRMWLGDLLLMGGPLMWAFFTVTVRALGINPFRSTAIISVFGLLSYGPIYLALGNPAVFLKIDPWITVGQGLFHGIVVVVVALACFTYSVRILGPVLTTLGTAAVPAITTLLAVPLLGEAISGMEAIGVTLDTIGLCLVAVAAASVRNGKIATPRPSPIRPRPEAAETVADQCHVTEKTAGGTPQAL